MDEQRAWWEALFQIHEFATYPELAQTLTLQEVDFLEQVLMLRPEQPILDLACGNGRHLLELAGRGYAATGIELSAPVAAYVAEQISAQGSSAQLVQGDMRDLEQLGAFECILIMNSSFGFWSDAEQAALLQSISAALHPGGRLLLQCINPYQISRYMQGYRRGWHAVGPGYVLRESQFNPLAGSLETAYRYIESGTGEVSHPGETIRLYTFLELRQMLGQAGLQPISVFGDTTLPAQPFGEESQWQVIIAQKPRQANPPISQPYQSQG